MKILNSILAGLISFLFISCSGDTTTTPVADVAYISINETNTTIYSTDGASNLTANAYYTDGSSANITAIALWRSMNTELLKVSAYGIIQAIGNGGDADVIISHKDIISKASRVKIIKVLDFNLSILNADANTTGTYDLRAIATFEDNTSKIIVKNIKWDANNSAIITGEGNTTQIQITMSGDTNITATLFSDTNLSKTLIYHAD